jgi:hypothetical protein
VLLETSALKVEAVVAAEEGTPQEEERKKEHRATGRKVRPITDVASTSLGRKER